ncbi:MAG: DNA methyltransferase [Chitinophagales bacterium]
MRELLVGIYCYILQKTKKYSGDAIISNSGQGMDKCLLGITTMEGIKRMMENFYNTILDVLKQDERFFSEKGEILRNAVFEAAMRLDKDLIRLLLSNPVTKNKFFVEVDGVSVFDKVQFGWLINNRQFLPDSFTRYKNRIGLVDYKGYYISEKNDIELVFPYKDCILEGGQTREDQKRDEIFYNETLAPDEVDRLLSPKVFTNAKHYSLGRTDDATDLKDSDNLIVRGNNLLALSSLLKRYEGKVKCIYIDPPYNTGSDSFGYNDSFSRSTWLTFMKNRIDVAKKMMCREGVLLVQCSFHHYPYLKLLLDEVMGEKNYRMTFHILVRHPERILTGDKEFNDVIEYILVYSANPEYKMPKKSEAKTIDDYVYEVELLTKGKSEVIDNKRVEIFLPSEYRVHKGEPGTDKFKTLSIRGSIREKNSSGRFYVKNIEKLIGQYPPLTLFKVEGIGDDIYDFRYFHLPKEGNKNGTYFQGMPTSSDTTYTPYANFYDFMAEYNVVNDEGEVVFRNGKKPEALVSFLLSIFTREQDLVMDYHLGSGTTCATAHKMNRQYIGIEQLDYGSNDSVIRLQNVINGDRKGISDTVNWRGGGSFVYCELKQLNQEYVDLIQVAENDKEVWDVWQRIHSTGFISSLISVKEIDEAAEDYQALTLEDKKKFFMTILDKNMLYVNLCDIDDEDFKVSEAEKQFARSFYRRG